MGKSGFIWLVGVVENRIDPLGLGRCQIRAFGWHDDGNPQTKIKLKIDDLPWATPLLPCNAAKTFPVTIPGFTPSKDDLSSFNNVTVT